MEERIPNGDVSTVIKQFEKELTLVKNKNGELSLRDKARFIVAAEELKSVIEYYTDYWKEEIKAEKEFKEDFIDLKKSVILREGSAMTGIDVSVVHELTTSELMKAVTVTEKGLTAAGRADLIEKYKVGKGVKAPSVLVRPLK